MLKRTPISPLLQLQNKKFKRAICLMVVLLLLLSMASTAFASVTGMDDFNIMDDEYVQEIEDNAGLPERMVSNIIINFANFLYRILGLQDLNMLIFNVFPDSQDLHDDWDNDFLSWNYDPDDMILHTFPAHWFDVIEMFYIAVEMLLPAPMVVAIAIVGFMLFVSSVAGARTASKDYLLGIFIALLALRFGPYFFSVIFDINMVFVDILREVAENTAGVPISQASFLELFYQPEARSFGIAVVTIVGVMMVAVLNFQYTVRMITLGVLLMLFPVMAFLSVFPQLRQVITFWFKELVSNVFLQTGHAAVMAFFFSLMYSDEGLSLFVMFIFLTSLNSTANLIRTLIGGAQAPRGAAGMGMGMLGLGALMSVGRMAKGRMTGGGGSGSTGGVGDAVSHATGGGSGSGGIGELASKGIASPESAGASLKKIGGTALSVGGGLSGAMAGGVVSGALTGNPGLGMTVGGLGGAHLAGGAGASLGSAGDFVNNTKKEATARGTGFKKVASEKLGMQGGLILGKEGGSGQLYHKQSMGTIGQRVATQVFGASEGSLGSSLGHLAGKGVSTGARTVSPKGRNFGDKIEDQRNEAIGQHQEATRKYDNNKPEFEASQVAYQHEYEKWKDAPLPEGQTVQDLMNPEIKQRYRNAKLTDLDLKKDQIQAADKTRHESVGNEMKIKAEQLRKSHKANQSGGGDPLDVKWNRS